MTGEKEPGPGVQTLGPTFQPHKPAIRPQFYVFFFSVAIPLSSCEASSLNTQVTTQLANTH